MTVPSFAFVTLFSNPLSRHKQITYVAKTALFNKVFVDLKEFCFISYHMV